MIRKNRMGIILYRSLCAIVLIQFKSILVKVFFLRQTIIVLSVSLFEYIHGTFIIKLSGKHEHKIYLNKWQFRPLTLIFIHLKTKVSDRTSSMQCLHFEDRQWFVAPS
jgi:hypothetical protein